MYKKLANRENRNINNVKGEKMKELIFKINDKNGLHARPAGVLSESARKYKSDIVVRCDEKEANAKRLLSLMALGATNGKELHITINGEDENEAEVAIKSVLEKALG